MRLFSILLTFLLFNCTTPPQAEVVKSNDKQSIILNETHLGSIPLVSLNPENIKKLFEAEFEGANVNKSIGKQDGPDFDLYTVKLNEYDIIYISMDHENPKKVSRIKILTTNVEDEFGVQVGMEVKEIKEKRKEISFHADLHANMFASVSESKISYELNGVFKSLEDGNFADENYEVKPWQVEGMAVGGVIWMND